MPWRCPACGIPIRHSEAELAPRLGVRYRCHVCRLELVVDPDDQKLTVPPVDDGGAKKGPGKGRKSG